MTSPKSELLKAAAQSLEAMAQEVEELGTDLLLDPHVAQNHLMSLQSLDRWSQQLVQLANVLSSKDPIAAADLVTPSDFRDHLCQAAQHKPKRLPRIPRCPWT